jgi:predicted secreted protein
MTTLLIFWTVVFLSLPLLKVLVTPKQKVGVGIRPTTPKPTMKK